MSHYIVETKNLTKRYREITALKNVNIKVKKGIHGFIGPNGAGKTTTIKILLNLVTPTSGNAQIFGLDAQKDTHEIRKRIGVLLENFNIPSDMTALDYLIFVSRLYNYSEREAQKRCLEILKLLDLIDATNREFGTFSAGMKRKLGLGAALIGNPELVILDEPTANIDPASRIKIREIIKRYYKEFGTSFFISSHILTELERVCKTYSIIHKGQIIAEGTLDKLSRGIKTNTYQIKVSDIDKLIDFLSTKDYVDDIFEEEEIVTINVKNVDLFQDDLFSFLRAEKIRLELFQSIATDLEEIFKNIIGRTQYE